MNTAIAITAIICLTILGIFWLDSRNKKNK